MSKKMVEGRADSSPVKPTGSLTGLNEIFCVQIANTEKSIARAREERMEMLSELSDKALAYVWRPIAYAYNWTDGHDTESLSKDDVWRMNLVCAVAHGSPEVIDRIADYRAFLERKERRIANGQAD